MKVLHITVLVLFAALFVACPSEKKDDSAANAIIVALSGSGNCTAPTFVESAASLSAGQSQYSTQCSGCHGATGGGGAGVALTGYSNRATYQTAAAKIHCTMPLGNPTACQNDCARDVAKYIRTL